MPENEHHNLGINKLDYLTFLVIGISYLWPWNSFLSATPYFITRLEGYSLLQASVSSSLMFVSTLTSTGIFIVLVRRQKNADYTARIVFGELVIAAAFFFLAVSCVLFTSISTVVYYLFLLASMLIATFGTSFAQNGSFSIVNLFGSIYTQAIMVGQSIAGILPPILSILTAIYSIHARGSLTGQDQDTVDESKSSVSSFLYFIVATFIALLAIFLLYLLNKKKAISKASSSFLSSGNENEYHIIRDCQNGDRNISGQNSSTQLEFEAEMSISEPILKQDDSLLASLHLFKKLKVPAITVFLVFSITLAFPVFLQVVAPVHSRETSVLFYPEVFMPFALFIWNLGDFFGRVCCAQKQWVVKSERTMLAYAMARIIFIPLYFMCNINGRGGIINNDVVYFFIHFFFGITNGHLGTSAMMQSGSYVNEHEKAQAGSFMTLMISLGLTAGALFSFVLVACVHQN